MVTVILVEPQNSGNIGAVARAMNNFGFGNLILVNPKADHLNKEALDRSCHAKNVLKEAKVEKKLDFIKDFELSIATTGVIGTNYNILRTSISSVDIAKRLKESKKKNVAFIFGREDHGLKNEELELTDIVVTIPTNKENPALNLSHAVSIVSYEASKVFQKDDIISHFTEPTGKEKEVLDKTINDALNNLEFTTDTKRNTAYKALKRVILKAAPSKRELIALIGLFKKVK
ncbi:RNA methyltransferase [Candidatus Woesearchaeota archaeon]|nr:MAG: RNA methyltransferase [Candidatus Woesearchaeota archaeon]